MSRWTYLIPRLIILALLAVAIWASADPLARRIVVRNLENTTGTKVNIAQLKCSFAKSKIYLKGLTIADPKNPMKNLIQADMAYLDLDFRKLLNRQVVIEYGQASKVMFGVPRTQVGTLDEALLPIQEEADAWTPKSFVSMDRVAQTWVDQLSPSSGVDLSTINSTLKSTAEKAVPKWKSQLDEISQAIFALQKKKAELKEITRSNFGNPLRRNQVNSSGIEEANLAVQAIQTQLTELTEKIESDRNEFVQAYQLDTQQLKQIKNGTVFEGNSISTLLLSEMHEEYVGNVLGWLHWFQSAIPNPVDDFSPTAKRGVNVPLRGVKQAPGFLIKTIDLEGEGWFANRHLDFAGTANNLSAQPKLHDQPASFDIRAQGNEHFIVSCVLDRRGKKPIDTLGILCPDLEVSERTLGNKNSMQVTLGPESRVQADINIQVIGDQITGDIVFRHSNVSLHVDEIHEYAGGKNTALQMNRGLASINRFESKIQLSGSIHDYEFSSQSDLGQQFAQSVNEVLNQKSSLVSVQSLRNLDKMYKAQISQIDEDVLPLIHRMAQTISAERIEIASIKDSLSPTDFGSTRLR